MITSVQRRRRWLTAEKIRLVEETMQPRPRAHPSFHLTDPARADDIFVSWTACRPMLPLGDRHEFHCGARS